MSFFNQSTKTVSAVIAEIAGSVGASGDPDMLPRAMNSLNAAIEYLHTRADWDFLFTEGNLIQTVAPFSVTGVSASAGQSSAACPVGHGFLTDDLVSFPGVLAGTRVSATASGGIGLNSTIMTTVGTGTVVVTASGARDYYAVPTSFRKPYSLRSVTLNVALRLMRRRLYDRTTTSELTPSTPDRYDIAPIPTKGKLRLLPLPSSADVLELSHFRRITLASSTSDSATFDMPADFEPFVIAYAKWHFIADKSEGRGDQMTTWLTFADNGLRSMLADQARQPDEDLRFIPGAAGDGYASQNSTRNLDYNYT